jgi:predicted HD phosphohydrolase
VGHPGISLADIERLLAAAADRPVVADDGSALGHSQLDHARQTAALLRRAAPGDDELAVAGLVHDLGHLLPGVGDAEHAPAGAAAVRAVLGERVAGLVGLHVEAKRYLVASEAGYAGDLAADSVASLDRQGGPMALAECRAFEARPFAAEAVVLRRADEGGKVAGLQVADLGDWLPLLRRVHQRYGTGGTSPRHAG